MDAPALAIARRSLIESTLTAARKPSNSPTLPLQTGTALRVDRVHSVCVWRRLV
jgi:hypothetical protein